MVMIIKTQLPVWCDAVEQLPNTEGSNFSSDLILRMIDDSGYITIDRGYYVDFGISNDGIGKYWINTGTDQRSIEKVGDKLIQNFAVTHYMVIS